MTKFRWHRGSLADSMATVVEVADRAALVAIIEAEWHWLVPGADIDINPYGYDKRIGWDTYLVTVQQLDGTRVVAGMTDGPL